MGEEKRGGVLKLFLIYFLLSFFILFLDKKGWLSWPRAIVTKPLMAVEKEIYSFKLSSFQSLNFLGTTKGKDIEVQRLEGELRQLAVDQNLLAVCLEENEHFKRLLGAPLSPKWKFIEAKVVGVAEKMRLNRGEKDGVKEDMLVIYENILVGRVALTGEHDSLVRLPDDPDSKIPVVIRQPASPAGGPASSVSPDRAEPVGGPNSIGVQARGLLVGQFGGKLILDRVLQNEDIQKGDLVVTSGEEDWLADLLIGQIQQVLPRTAEVYQRAIVSSLIDYRSLRMVFLVVSQG